MTPRRRAACLLMAAAVSTGLVGALGPSAHADAVAATDTFTRTTANGWGTTTSGAAYAHAAAAADFSVREDAAVVRVPVGASRAADLPTATPVDADVQISVLSSIEASGGGQFVSVAARRSASGEYRARVHFAADRSVRLALTRATASGAETALAPELTLPGITHAGGTYYNVRFQVTGTAPAVLRARVWPDRTPEPATWSALGQDAAPLSGGAVGLRFFLTKTSAAAASFSVDDLTVLAVGTTLPPPTPSVTEPSTATPAPAGAPAPGQTQYPYPSTALFVSPSGTDATATGAPSRPYKTVQAAVDAAPSGATLVLRAGQYHESVNTRYEARLTIQPYPGEAVWFDGSLPVTGWTYDGGAWRHEGWTARFPSYDKTGAMVDPAFPMAAHPDQVFLDGAPLQQVISRAAVTSGTFYLDEATSRLWIGSDPTGRAVRASALDDALFVNRGAGSVIRGIGFRRYATSVAQLGAVKVYADGAVIENCLFLDNAMAGLSVNGAGITLRSVTATGNGQLGVQAHTSDRLQVRALKAERNNRESFYINQASGGMKVTKSRDVVVRGSSINANTGSGLWFDSSMRNVTVVGNTLRNNSRHGAVFEISAGLVFAGNSAVDNGEAGVRILEAGHVKIYNNLVAGNNRGIDLMDGHRVAAAEPTSNGHDARYPYPDPYISWEVEDVRVRGNSVGAGFGKRSLIGYTDARQQFQYSSTVSANLDAYWRPSDNATDYFFLWGKPGIGQLFGGTLASFRSQTAQASASAGAVATQNPYVGAEGLPTISALAGDALPDDVARALELPLGTRLRAGLPARTP